jgi:hypothetical protein
VREADFYVSMIEARVARHNPSVSGVAKLRALRLANPIVRRVLESPVHGLLSARLLVLTYEGHRSGGEYRIPLGYAEAPDGRIVTLAAEPGGKKWWRSFAEPRPATLTVRGARIAAVGALAEGNAREEALALYVARHPRIGGAVDRAAVVLFDEERERRASDGPDGGPRRLDVAGDLRDQRLLRVEHGLVA